MLREQIAATFIMTVIFLGSVQSVFSETAQEQKKGKDNPVGEGDDEFNNKTGHSGPDGKRDDINDSAWTAPIWFVR